MKRKILVVTCSLLLMMSLATSAYAAESAMISTTNKTKSHTFKTDWSESVKKVGDGDGTHYLDYGYNTFLIHEDYAYANSNGYQHRSKIKNGNGVHYGPSRYANEGWSDQEVTHSGSTVEYYCIVIK